VPRQLVLDQGRDLDGRRLYRLVSIYGAPDWVKSASVDEICGNQIPAHLYADPAAHLYPTHTKAATWASLAFFLDNRAALPPRHAEIVLDRLVKAARFQGIGAYADELIAKSAELNRHDDARLPDDAFAYVANGPDGPVRRLRIINPLEVKAAAEWLHRHRDEIAYPDRQKIARRVLVKAAEFGVGLGAHDDFLEKTAGFGGCSCAQAVAAVRQRVTLASRHLVQARPHAGTGRQNPAGRIRWEGATSRGRPLLLDSQGRERPGHGPCSQSIRHRLRHG
jgi:hypothetical protein